MQERLALVGGGSAPRPPAKEPITGRQRGLFALTYVAYIALYFARKPISVVKPVLEEELSLTRDSLALVDTSLLAAYAVGQLSIGQVNRFLTRQQMLTGSFLICGLATLATGFSNNAMEMGVFSAFAGFFAACVNPLLVIVISEAFPASMRASIVGLWQTSQQAGGIAANNFASLVLAYSGWRQVFFLSGLVVSFFALPLYFALGRAAGPSSDSVPRGGGPRGKSSSPPPVVAAEDTETPPGFFQALQLPGVSSVAFSYMLVKMARYCLMLWLPTYFRTKVGMSAASAGAMASIFDAGGVLGGVCAGLVTDTVAKGRMVLVTMPMCLLAAASFMAWGLLSGSGELWNAVCMAVAGFLIAGPDGILGGAASKNVCEYNGKGAKTAPAVSGTVNGIASLGVIVMSAFTSKLVDRFGWNGLFTFLGAMMLAAAATVLSAVRVELRHFRKNSGS